MNNIINWTLTAIYESYAVHKNHTIRMFYVQKY